MSAFIAVAADLLVAVLLAATIATSLRLSKRIRGLKADEAAMRSTIAELAAAADTAERAVARLGTLASECQRSLADKLRTAERYAADLDARIQTEQSVIARVQSIVDISRSATRPAEGAPAAGTAPGVGLAAMAGSGGSPREQILKAAGSTLEAMMARNATRAA